MPVFVVNYFIGIFEYWCEHFLRGNAWYIKKYSSSHWDYFRKYLFFSSNQEDLFLDFSRTGGFMCSPNRYQEHPFRYRTDTDFPGALFFGYRTKIPFFQDSTFFWLPNRYLFSRKPFSNINEQIGNFQEADISALGLGGCFRK